MQVLSASATAGLVLKAKADTTTFPGGAGALKTGTATIGDATATRYPAADIGYAVKITANTFEEGESAYLILDDGLRGAEDISVTCVPATPIDCFGVTLPAMDKLFAVRITASADNSKNILLTGLTINEGTGGSEIITPGETKLMLFAQAGLTIPENNGFDFEFAAAGDSVTVEILARATPA